EGGQFEGDGWKFTRAMSKKLAAKGWLTLAWPKEHGGQARPILEQLVWREETTYHRVPGVDMGVGGISWVGPMLMRHGTGEQKQHLNRIAAGEEYWCTLYSEPSAGSDLASLQTRAVKDGDDYVVNGSKIWTSGGHHADFGWLAARTDPNAPKHRGVSMFLLDMKLPGVTVRPIINMAGAHSFNEVFFDNVRVPARARVGEENTGWYILATALDLERSGVHASAGGRRNLEELAKYVADQRVTLLPVLRHRFAEMAIETNVSRYLAYRVGWMQAKGLAPNVEASISKLYGSEFGQRLAGFAIQVFGLYGQAEPGNKWTRLRGRFEKGYLGAVSATIAAGTSEVQRSIIANRGLGLPR
ncbi:MAG: acyl-CoA dehydrogenase family protein, partial [Chloroflexi bacterium]|nr:acyl-CoA dehydrogenase family protein [Chloroflexota bacterium]